MEEILKLENITKKFIKVIAVNNLTLSIKNREIHALVGENGAGKTTLIKIICGAYKPCEGKIIFDGNLIKWQNVFHAMSGGISVVHQELTAALNVNVAQNIFVNREPCNFFGIIKWKELYDKAEKILKTVGMGNVSPWEKMSNLSIAERQMVEIAKAYSFKTKVLIFDEPTSSLTSKETKKLFEIIRELNKKENITIIYISHKIQEIFEIANRVSVMRDGKLINTFNINDITPKLLIKNMVGREIEDMYPKRKRLKSKKEILRIENFSSVGKFNNINFSLYESEILGIAGLIGAGRTELAKSIFGVIPISAGKIYLNGKQVKISNPKEAIEYGIFYLSEDRDLEGVFHDLNICQNIISANIRKFSNLGLIYWDRVKMETVDQVERFNIKISSIFQNVKTLSGGNKQKVLFSRAICTSPKILILDEPTKGIDVNTKSEMYFQMRNLTDKGVSIIMISSELPEIIGVSDRIMVMHEGNVKGILDGKNASEEKILSTAIF